MRQGWFLVVSMMLCLVSSIFGCLQDPEDECDPNPCKHGSCTDGNRTFTCQCDAGYTGKTCCSNIDDCLPQPCNNGTCLDAVNNYTCTCNPGYTGRNCEVDIDECATNQCINTTCTDGVNSYTCACQEGYTGNCDTLLNLATDYVSVNQSSLYPKGEAYKGVDGNTDSAWGGGSCTHTSASEYNPSWHLVMKQAYNVKRVVITNRQDCCSHRLQSLDVKVGNTTCAHYAGPPASGEVSVDIPCGQSIHGNTITITKTSGTILTMCEVQIYVA